MNDTKIPPLARKITIGMAGLLVLIVLPLYAYKVSQLTGYTDFYVYYRTALRAKALNWAQIYTLADGTSPFRYMPFFLPLFRPFAELDQIPAQVLWYLIQFLAFGGGFVGIYKTLRAVGAKDPLWITSVSLLFILRFCLDTFTIGQVSSLMFLGFSWGLYGWIVNRTTLNVLCLSVPTLFKIGPGILYGIFLSSNAAERNRALRKAVGFAAVLGILSEVWGRFVVGSSEAYHQLWKSWSMIVASDSDYYDASHYGSQSFKSVLLRGVKAGWISPVFAQDTYLAAVVLVSLGVLLFWLLRTPRSALGRGLFLSVGLFPYFWLMPETFKYSLTPLAIPVAFLLACLLDSQVPSQGKILSRTAIIFGALTLSLAGKDVIGDFLFFGSQKLSLPFVATLLLGIATFKQAWNHSNFSSLALFLGKSLDLWNHKLGPWETPPSLDRPYEGSILVPVPLYRDSSFSLPLIRKVILELDHLAESAHQEVLLIYYTPPEEERIDDCSVQDFPLLQELGKIRGALKKTRILEENLSRSPKGRGIALRQGYLVSKGKQIFIVNLDQPCGIGFLKDAQLLLSQGFGLVRANRRAPKSHFKIPVRLLPLVYKRHRMGLLFNRWVRLLLPIETTDTHSGTCALSEKLAGEVFATQVGSGFLFDLELGLTAKAQGFREKDLPVEILMESEKTFKRILYELLIIFFGLPHLAWRFHRGYYQGIPKTIGITADDWGLSPEVNQGILKLAKQGIVRRVSLMANAAHLKDGLDELLALGSQVELGLHFNLTYGKPCHVGPDSKSGLIRNGIFLPSPSQVLRQWLFGGNRELKQEFVRKEIQIQLEILRKLGVPLRSLDGHHHIHMIPGIIDVIAPELQKSGIHRVRLPYDPLLFFSSQAPISFLALLAQPRFKKWGFTFLPFTYPTRAHFEDQGRLRARLAKHPESEIIVHPARGNDLATLEYPDGYTDGRVTEYRALSMLGQP